MTITQHIFYPAWPTSQPGPQATLPLPGQHPHRIRTDQMVYECYDQERGIPCVSPLAVVVAHQRVQTYLPAPWLLDVETFEAEELARWLDDGGASCEVEQKKRRVGENGSTEKIRPATPILV